MAAWDKRVKKVSQKHHLYTTNKDLKITRKLGATSSALCLVFLKRSFNFGLNFLKNLWKTVDEIVDVCQFGRLNNLLIGYVFQAIRNVLTDFKVEKRGFLKLIFQKCLKFFALNIGLPSRFFEKSCMSMSPV